MKNETEFLTPGRRLVAWIFAIGAGCTGASLWMLFLAGITILTWQAVLG